MRRLLAVPDARRLIAGEGLSMLGDRAMFLVLGIWAKDLTGSNAAAGLVFFAFLAPILLGPVGGLLADRVRRRPLMIATDLGIAAVTLLLFLVEDESDLWILYLVAALYGLSSIVFASAQSALLKTMLPEELLADANAVLQTIREGVRLVAPLAGAALYALWGGGWVAAMDAATFVVSALALASLTLREPKPEPPERRIVTEVLAGIRHIWDTLPLREIVGASAVALFVIGFTETLIFAVIDEGLGREPAFLGVLAAFQGAGAIVGGLLAARVLRIVGDGRLLASGLALFAFGCAFLIAPSLPPVLVGQALAGAGIAWAVVGFGTSIQLRSPLPVLGRVHAAAETLVGTPQTASIALGAVLASVFDYKLLLAIVAGVVAAAAIYLITRADLALPVARPEVVADRESLRPSPR